MRYYAIRVALRSELDVGKVIDRVCGLPTLVPVEYKWRRRNPRSHRKARIPCPLLPGYVVAGLGNWDEWHMVARATYKALGLVGMQQEPRALSGREVAWMVKMVARTDRVPAGGVRALVMA